MKFILHIIVCSTNTVKNILATIAQTNILSNINQKETQLIIEIDNNEIPTINPNSKVVLLCVYSGHKDGLELPVVKRLQEIITYTKPSNEVQIVLHKSYS